MSVPIRRTRAEQVQPILELLKRGKALVGAGAFIYPVCNVPVLQAEVRAWAMQHQPPGSPHWFAVARKNRSLYVFDADAVMASIHPDTPLNEEFNLLVMRVAFMSVIPDIDDELLHFAHLLKTQERWFLRHIRNAISHGNRFKFEGDTHLPATFGPFTIDRSLKGMKAVLFDFIGPGDLVDLFDVLEAQLRQEA